VKFEIGEFDENMSR